MGWSSRPLSAARGARLTRFWSWSSSRSPFLAFAARTCAVPARARACVSRGLARLLGLETACPTRWRWVRWGVLWSALGCISPWPT
eukprot:13870097-Alexandrium_andersonii.AAC.1